MSKASDDKKYMRMALDLAQQGIGDVEPNPAVGCVIVKGNRVIGKGYHKKFGGPHAEIEAINDCRKNGDSPKNATMYVTLEPCCHHGKTPPCSQAVIDAGIKRVVIAVKDPSPHAAGGGIKQLLGAVIEVNTGICEKQSEDLNRWFFHYARTDRPWVIVKWAQSIDGYLAYKDAAVKGQWISGEQSRKDVHAIRRQCQAILTGIGTVIADDPQLTPRPANGKHPLRVVLDSKLQIPEGCNLLKPSRSATIVFTTAAGAASEKRKMSAIRQNGVEVIALPGRRQRCDIDRILDELGKRGVQQLLVEAGPTLITSFLKNNLANELRIYVSPKRLGEEGAVSISKAMKDKFVELGLKKTNLTRFGDDICVSEKSALKKG